MLISLPPGAGKSTFVDILAGKRKANGTVTGSVKMFAENGDQSQGKHRIGFVDQVRTTAISALRAF